MKQVLAFFVVVFVLGGCMPPVQSRVVSEKFSHKCLASIPTQEEIMALKAEGKTPILFGCLNQEGDPSIDISVEPEYVDDDEITFVVMGNTFTTRDRGVVFVQELCPSQNLDWIKWSDDPRGDSWAMADTNVSCLPSAEARQESRQEACRDSDWLFCTLMWH